MRDGRRLEWNVGLYGRMGFGVLAGKGESGGTEERMEYDMHGYPISSRYLGVFGSSNLLWAVESRKLLSAIAFESCGILACLGDEYRKVIHTIIQEKLFDQVD